jgi:arsenite methyltransferase
MMSDADEIRSAVLERYGAAATTASCCGPSTTISCCGPADAAIDMMDVFGSGLYDDDQRSALPEAAVLASLGCGNPTALAQLQPGEIVLDLGSGGGIDVLLSARRVGPDGRAYGLDMTPQMLDLARANQAKAGVTNVEFLYGSIEDVPLPDATVDVIISNCVINLSADKAAVFREAFRVLAPGGRLAISDVVLERALPAELSSIMALWTGCIAGALTEGEVRDILTAAGFVDIDIEPTSIFGRSELEGLAAGLGAADVPAGVDIEQAMTDLDGVIRSAFIRAAKPALASATPTSARPVKETRMPAIHVYEPALCCNTGVCGPDVDQSLVTFTADLEHLTAQGADIARHNLANDPLAFAQDETVRAFLEVAGSDGLPLTLVDGVTVMTGSYPTREQLARFAGLASESAPAGASLLTMVDGDDAAAGSCGPSGCC